MKSSFIKILSIIYLILGVIGIIVLANKVDGDLKAIIIIMGVVSTIFSFCFLYAIGSLLDFAEENKDIVFKIYEQLRHDKEPAKSTAPKPPVNASNTKADLFGVNASGNTWRCKKCGSVNSTSSASCKDCGSYK